MATKSTPPTIERSRGSLQEVDTDRLPSDARRNFLRQGVAIAGGAAAAGASFARAETLAIPESNKGMGKPIPPDDYGVPSKYEALWFAVPPPM